MAIGTIPHRPGIEQVSNRGRAREITSRPRPLSKKARIKRALALLTLALLTGMAGLFVYGVWRARIIAEHLPDISNIAEIQRDPVTRIISSDGVLLATLETQHRRPVALSEISPLLVNATVATEDSRFYEHSGVDGRGILRALFSNVREGNSTGQGGSTITQQLARNLYLSNEKTFHRKFEELLLARKIEATYSKQEILEAYLNTIYYGEGCYGIEAASQAYFNKKSSDLTLGEAALLAGIPQRPYAYSPVNHLDAALKRRSDVLNRLVTTGKISNAEKAQAEAAPIHVLHPRFATQNDWKAPYFVARVLAQLREQYGEEFLYSGAQITTTLNWQMQKAAEQSLRTRLEPAGNGPNTGALVSIDPRSGYVRALVGGANFKQDQFDAVTQGVRQPGSAFKPFVYVTAFDMNVCNLTNTVTDKKLTYANEPNAWVVHNYDDHYRGETSVLQGIRHSINTIAVQVADSTGPSLVADTAKRLGISTPIEPNLPMALGASGVHPIDLCSAYSAFANGGNRYEPILISQITDSKGGSVFSDDPQKRLHASFLNEQAVNQINLALREVVLHGTGTGASGIPDAHGKTGTTSSRRDAWFVGYTADLATAVWMGHVHKEHAPKGQHGLVVSYTPMPGVTGGRLCAPVWRDYMATALPVQKKVNQAHHIPAALIAAPENDSFLASLDREKSQTSIGQQTAEATQQAQLQRQQEQTDSGAAPFQASYKMQPQWPDESEDRDRQERHPATEDENEDEAMRRDEAKGLRELEHHRP